MIDTTSMSIMANYVQPTSTNMSSHMISQKDSDSDESLSINEFGISEDFFTSIDSDQNGLVNQSELSSAIDAKMSEFDGAMPSKSEFQSMLEEFGFEVPSINTISSINETVSSILADYDPDNLTQSDAQEIVAAFKDAGIQPGSELESAMKEAGFDAHEVGTLAGVGAQGNAGGGPSGGGGQSGGGSSSESEEDYDVMDINEDGVVSFDEMQEYYGLDTQSENTLSSSNQNALDNLQLLMHTLKSSSNDESLDTNSFSGLLKTINNQNNNSDLNTYLQNTSSSSMFAYA